MATDYKGIAEAAFLRVFRPLVPRDTGNMRYNATTFTAISPTEFVIRVDPSVAPYVAYTNERWTSPRLHGRANPNEGWFERAAKAYAAELTRALGGISAKQNLDTDKRK